MRRVAKTQRERINLTLYVQSDKPIDQATLEELQQLTLSQLKKPVDIDVHIEWVQHYKPRPNPSMNAPPGLIIPESAPAPYPRPQYPPRPPDLYTPNQNHGVCTVLV